MSTGLWLGEAANLLVGFRAVWDPTVGTASPFFPPAAGPVTTFEPDQVTEQGEWELRREPTSDRSTCSPPVRSAAPYGALWGYDFARPPSWPPPRSCSRPKNWDQFDPERRERILNGPPRVSGARLFDAAEYPFGHNNDGYRHPPLPGSMVTCANKSKSLLGHTTHTGETPAVRGSDKSKAKKG